MIRATAIVIFLAGVLALPGGTVRTLAGKSYSGYVRFVDGTTLGIGPAKGEVVKVPLEQVAYASFEPPDDLSQLEQGSPLAGKGTGLLGAYYSRPAGHTSTCTRTSTSKKQRLLFPNKDS